MNYQALAAKIPWIAAYACTDLVQLRRSMLDYGAIWPSITTLSRKFCGLAKLLNELSAWTRVIASRVHATPGDRPRYTSLYSHALSKQRAPDGKSRFAASHIPRPDLRIAEVLVRSGLCDPATLRHGDGRRDLPCGHFFAGGRPGAMECGLCSGLAPAHRRALRRQ